MRPTGNHASRPAQRKAPDPYSVEGIEAARKRMGTSGRARMREALPGAASAADAAKRAGDQTANFLGSIFRPRASTPQPSTRQPRK